MKKRIQNLRILRKDFSLSLQIAQQQAFEILRQNVSTLGGNQVLLGHSNFLQRFSIDVDYFRLQELFDQDQFTYTAVASLERGGGVGQKLVLSTSKGELHFYNLENTRIS